MIYLKYKLHNIKIRIIYYVQFILCDIQYKLLYLQYKYNTYI